MTKKTLFFKAVKELNIGLLDVLLDDTPICKKLRNDLFIERMEVVFNTFKASKDTFLLQYKGNCLNTECENKCKGYVFVGNHSKKQFHVLCEETEEDLLSFYPMSNILRSKDISTENVENIPFPTTYCIDEVDYDGRYNSSIRQMDKAVRELIQDNDGFISKHDYIPWVEKYEAFEKENQKLKHEFKHPFFDYYQELSELCEYLQKEEEVARSMQAYNILHKINEKSLLEWLVQYQEFGLDISCFMFDKIDNDKLKGFLPLRKVDNTYYYYGDLLFLDNFCSIFDELYYTKLDKFSTYHERDYNSFADEESKNATSLRFHLADRGIELS
ncbi:MAG: hypothetical protein KBA86_08930 [Bacteroidales bacterium]|nr:hypothetical protein [Bacteroidales bacterium]